MIKWLYYLRHQIKKYNNIDDFYKSDIWGIQEERFKAPLDFIEVLRERMIILEVAEEQNISPDKVKLTKEDNDRVGLKDAKLLKK